MDSKGMLAKVRALLDTAESLEAQGNSAAADTYYAKAKDLRDKYAIAEEELIAQDPTSVLPVCEELTVVAGGSPFQQEHVNMFHYVARHAGVRVTFRWNHTPGQGYTVIACCVGYEGDLRYADLIYTNARLVFTEKLEPKPNPALSEQVNVYRLRAAGIERVRVADMMWGDRSKANLSKVGRLYKAECAARGEEALLSGRGVTGAVYREQYASEFTFALDARLRRTQDAAGQFGGGLVLHGRQERVDEAFYTRYPDLRPKPALPVGDTTPTPCEKCAAAKKRKDDDTATCRDHRPYTVTKKDLARYERYNSAAAQRGRAAGATAAAHVELNRAGREGIDA